MSISDNQKTIFIIEKFKEVLKISPISFLLATHGYALYEQLDQPNYYLIFAILISSIIGLSLLLSFYLAIKLGRIGFASLFFTGLLVSGVLA